jgi:Flp pilus assembly pilin Flp
MLKFIKRLLVRSDGQDLIEYALLAAFISIATLVALAGIGGDVGTTYQKVNTSIAAANTSDDPGQPSAGAGAPGSGNGNGNNGNGNGNGGGNGSNGSGNGNGNNGNGNGNGGGSGSNGSGNGAGNNGNGNGNGGGGRGSSGSLIGI